ncbi:CRISPR-associated protein CasA/Cse1 [Corynebacterium atrinae]|uniref:type I-E CRISPR-associated protein Cse1/CasA n=1 Tax=Corynebacterium atrinae TaxID=1336740 RepID=UPI0025B5A328|nr:type I-E CRISPR-associated protein Cse1/CasA [Corynebacterium atrinae]WJY64494.1 CRISPR-associated protein CasA/Cse1 [Corynebacterium atrinae]
MNEPPTFSLLTEPWIKCVTADGRLVQLGIREIFDGSKEIRGLRGDSPPQDYAVLRLLLSIYWRAHRTEVQVSAGSTFDFSDWFDDELERLAQPDTAVSAYLDQYEERFDLLHSSKPFMQVADLRTPKDSTSPVRRIVPELESGYFSMRAGTGRETLGLDEAARWLVYAQAYDYSGIKSGAVGDERVKGGKGYPIGTGWTGRTGGTVVLGADLRQTMLLNTTLPALAEEEDRPVWERNPDTAAERHVPQPDGAGELSGPQGPNDLATWQSRRIRLYVEGDRVVSALVSNGDRIPDAGANVLDDPMTPYRFSKNQSKKDKIVHYAQPFDPDRTMWRSLEPLISLDRDPGFDGKNVAPKRPKNLSQLAELAANDVDVPSPLNVELVSVAYGPQDSSVATTVSSRIELPVALLEPEAAKLRAEIINTADATRDSAIALGQFAGQLLQAAGGEYEFQPTHTDGVLAELEPRFIEWLGQLEAQSVKAYSAVWQEQVKHTILERATEIMRGAGPKALAGREVKNPDGNTTRILSAGSAYRMLQGRLKKILTLIDPDIAPKEKK